MHWDFSHNGPWQKFGWRDRKGGEWHLGRDYGTKGKLDVPLGVPKYCNGWICYPVLNNKIDGMGNQVIFISPDGKEMVRFGHIETGTISHLKNGQILKTGDWIGNIAGVGKTESSYQPHIHVEHGLNPKYELIEMHVGKKSYRYKGWYCGEHTIKDYRDPNLGALPFSELEELTNMAFHSREAVLSGQKKEVKMADKMPLLTTDESNKEEGGFISWFKTTWIGRLFFDDDAQEKNKEKERTGPIIHRKTLVPTSYNSSLQDKSSGLSSTLSKNASVVGENQVKKHSNQNKKGR